MTKSNYTLYFDGYWIESHISKIPSSPGIYCVYACTYFHARNTVGINELLYIGESNDVGSRVRYHEQKVSWLSYVMQNRPGETICYNFAGMDPTENDLDRKRVEAALINTHSPRLNSVSLSLPNNTIQIKTQGRSALLQNQVFAHPSL